MNWFESTEWIEAGILPCSLPGDVWSKALFRASSGECGVVVIGFGINLCLFQWLHPSCLFNVFGLDKISLSTTVCLATQCNVISTRYFDFSKSFFTFHPWKLAVDICRLVNLHSESCLGFFFSSLVSLLLLKSWLCTSSLHSECLSVSFCSTVVSHLSLHLFSMTGATRLSTDSLNSMLARTSTLTVTTPHNVGTHEFISAKHVGALLYFYCNSALKQDTNDFKSKQ